VSFPAYQDYQDSGVEWLGELPSHWTVERLTHLYREAIEQGEEHLPILSVSIHSGVSDEEASPDESDRKITRSDDRTKYKKVLPGDLVYNMMRAWQGGFGAVQVPGMVSPAYVVARPRGDASSRYIELLLRTPGAVEEMRRLSRGITDFRLRLYWDEFKSIRVSVPPPIEREAILALLDRETAKIDALINEQRRLIVLLKEKRQAVISHAVTKGLDPHATMKDSGIEWLGEVPAHWTVKPLKRIGMFNAGAGFPHEEQGTEGAELSFHKVNALGKAGPDGILPSSDDSISRDTATRLRAFIFPAGSIVFAKIGAALLLGRIRQLDAPACLDNNMMGLIVGDQNNADFVRRIMTLVRFDLIANPGTVPSLNEGQIANVSFAFPPPAEQKAIAGFLLSQLGRFDELMAEAGRAIHLLIERRAALISAAVTGKIDVRASAKVLPFPVDRAQGRALVGTEIIERSAGQPTFGRVKFQKVAFLAEGHVGISELAGCYTRAAAGPLDGALIEDMERGANSIAGIERDQPGGSGTTNSYVLTQSCGAHRQELADWLGPDRTVKLDKLITDFAPLNTKQAEAVATLYGVWNDLLIEGAAPSDDEIITGFLNDWHPEKRAKFRASELPEWLGWMRRHGIVPTGSGPTTTTGRLFV
jgi:restriction endonuclease S subunit